MIPLFDALAHPTLKGQWYNQVELDASFSSLTHQLEEHGYLGACAVGMSNIAGYHSAQFMEVCQQYPRLFPVAGWVSQEEKNIQKEIQTLVKMGYKAIKIHPRFMELSSEDSILHHIVEVAVDHELIIFYCSYFYTTVLRFPFMDPLYSLAAMLKKIPQAKVIIVHGGGVDLLRYAELVRHNPNLLLDLSLTLMKYKNSSIDQDLQFLFESFDQRICIGSDFPEYDLAAVRARFEYFSKNMANRHIQNLNTKLR